jgi:hypothetical protein
LNPEPYFRVTGATPDSGAEVPGHETISIAFNNPIDPSLLSSIVVDPPAQLEWSISWFSAAAVSATLNNAPSGPLRVTVPAGVLDAFGHPLQHAFSRSVVVGGFAVTYAVGSQDFLDDPVRFIFTHWIDSATAPGAVQVDPPIAGGYRLSYEGYQMSIIPELGFAPQTGYRVSVDSSLHSSGGSRLTTPTWVAFTTPPFSLSSATPWDGSTGVSRMSAMMMFFNCSVDSASMRQAISVDPPITGTFFMVTPRGGGLIPESPLSPMTTYTFTVDSTLRTVGGFPLKTAARVRFTTGSAAQ